jgi:hypothetical protein
LEVLLAQSSQIRSVCGAGHFPDLQARYLHVTAEALLTNHPGPSFSRHMDLLGLETSWVFDSSVAFPLGFLVLKPFSGARALSGTGAFCSAADLPSAASLCAS